MENPELYIKHILPHQAIHYRHVMDTYFPHIRHGTNHSKSVLDIGCGPGKAIRDVILPYLEQDIKEVIGVDVSKTILDYANKTYGDDRFSFEEVDVSSEVPDKFVGRFDYIFSFMVFNWITDKRKLYSNILKMLKPNGRFLATYKASGTLGHITKELCQMEKYAPYLATNYQKRANLKMSPEELTNLLKDIGFESVFCQVKPTRYDNYTREDLEAFLITINPFHKTIPNNLQREFILDQVDRVDSVIDANGIRKFCLEDDLFVIYGRKKN
ncbi:juvenile hormone acid O-methyltransferase-like [Photinus pyralis]|uniref:Methyltransferase domain-containing protein n=1 Tax=Photinus pyralis TaxID=7054 RepID=A0A1Y1N7D8_PHOPY|nr:juvenile hormone acid O-methyltransferase-like [Photinus pyralis]XP_031352238.1 juvenile hormone acid O-methyltransferase-like [Photinus pyralis]